MSKMKTTDSPHDQINAWLDSDRNYTEGVILFQQFGRNPTLKKLFPGREYRYADKLAYELGKIAHVPPTNLKLIPGKVVIPERKPTPPAKRLLPSINLGSMQDSIPKTIAAILSKYSERYKYRSMLHANLKKVAPDNRADNVQKRKEISKEMEKVSNEMENLHQIKVNYETTGKLPETKNVFKKSGPGKPAEIDYKKVKQQRSNLMKSILKNNNRLDYQATKKGKRKNPMPEGPRRTELETNIKNKETELASCNRILANDPS